MRADYDIAIIGAGPAGLTAGIYTARADLSTVIIEALTPGGQVAVTDTVENYPGFPDPVVGFELAQKMQAQAARWGAELKTGKVTSIERDEPNRCWKLRLDGSAISALAVIVATGGTPRRLGIPGEEEFWGHGVSCCATCDGPLYRDKRVVVVGGGDTAVQEAHFLTRFVRKLFLVHRRDRLRANQTLQEQLLADGDKVELVWNAVPTEIQGKDRVEAVAVKNVKDESTRNIPCDGVFIFIGFTPNSDFLRGTVEMDEQGYVLTDEQMASSAPGVFACGDVRKNSPRQIVVACGEGAAAAIAAQHYVEELKGTAYR